MLQSTSLHYRVKRLVGPWHPASPRIAPHGLKSAPWAIRGIPSDRWHSASPRNAFRGLRIAPRAIRGIPVDPRRSASPRLAPRCQKRTPGDPRHPRRPASPHGIKSVPRAIHGIPGNPSALSIAPNRSPWPSPATPDTQHRPESRQKALRVRPGRSTASRATRARF